MSSITFALLSCVFIFGGALTGLLLRVLLPDHHMNDEGRDVVKIGAGLIATLAALVLGLLISSAKSSLDTMNMELTQSGAKIIVLDRVLANYGPEAREIREQLRTTVASAIKMIGGGKKTGQKAEIETTTTGVIEEIQTRLRGLSPRNDSQRLLQSQALLIAGDVTHARWLLIEQAASPLPKAFLVILLFWLVALFICFGLLAPHNATVAVVLFVCALSVSGAIFLILEMNTPITGIINISVLPLQNALEHLGK